MYLMAFKHIWESFNTQVNKLQMSKAKRNFKCLSFKCQRLLNFFQPEEKPFIACGSEAKNEHQYIDQAETSAPSSHPIVILQENFLK